MANVSTMNAPQIPDYRKFFKSLMVSTSDEINETIKRHPKMFNAHLFNVIREYGAHISVDSGQMKRFQIVVDQVIRPISRNTVQLFLTIPDKRARAEIAYNGWYLLNNQFAIEMWMELIKSSPSAEDRTELAKFIGLAKQRLHELFLEEQDPEQALNYLRNHSQHLDSTELVNHAASFIENYQPWCQAMVRWGEWFVNRAHFEPKIYPEAAAIGLRKAVEILEGSGERQLYAEANRFLGMALALHRIEIVEENMDAAIVHYTEALNFFTKDTNPVVHGNIKMEMGIAFGKKNKPDRSSNIEAAITCLEDALSCAGAASANILVNLGTAYLQRFIGDQQENIRNAIGYYEQALSLEHDGTFNLGITYNNVGIAYKLLKPFTENHTQNAINAFQAALSIRTEKDFPYEWAETLHNMGSVYGLLPGNQFFEYEDALERLEKALTIRTASDYPYDWAATVSDIARQHIMRFYASGEAEVLNGVKNLVDSALKIRSPEAFPYDAIDTSAQYALLMYQLNRFDEALPYLRICEIAFDNINIGAENLTTKSKLLEAYGYLFDALINSYLRTNNVRKAFKVCIKMKGVLLAERMASEKPDAAPYLGSREWAEITQITKSIHSLQIDIREALGNKRGIISVNKILQSLRELYRKRKLAIERLNYLYPLAAATNAFFLPEPEEVMTLACKLNGVIVEYYFIYEELVVFVVTSDDINVFELGKVDEIIEDFSELISTATKRARFDIPKEKRLLSAFYLHLVAPFEKLLKGNRNLILSPHKQLHWLPLHSALCAEKQVMLFETFDVSIIPGSNVLLAMAKRQSQAEKGKLKNALIIAHPGSGDKHLKFVNAEAQCVAAYFTDPLILDEANSTLSMFKKGLSENSPDVVHIACHSTFNSEYPSLSGLQLTDFVSVEAIVNNLKIPTNSLVCLSSCQSSVSAIGAGDDLTGLTQAFLQAGAGHVIGSLWLVNDRSTSMFFSEFYRLLSTDNENTHLALRGAVFAIRAAGYQSLFHWAPFQLYGFR